MRGFANFSPKECKSSSIFIIVFFLLLILGLIGGLGYWYKTEHGYWPIIGDGIPVLGNCETKEGEEPYCELQNIIGGVEGQSEPGSDTAKEGCEDVENPTYNSKPFCKCIEGWGGVKCNEELKGTCTKKARDADGSLIDAIVDTEACGANDCTRANCINDNVGFCDVVTPAVPRSCTRAAGSDAAADAIGCASLIEGSPVGEGQADCEIDAGVCSDGGGAAGVCATHVPTTTDPCPGGCITDDPAGSGRGGASCSGQATPLIFGDDTRKNELELAGYTCVDATGGAVDCTYEAGTEASYDTNTTKDDCSPVAMWKPSVWSANVEETEGDNEGDSPSP